MVRLELILEIPSVTTMAMFGASGRSADVVNIFVAIVRRASAVFVLPYV
jgi:hypothetical protein